MSRLKQNLTIDLMIQSINEVIKSQCSLSVKDVKVLNEAAQNLYKLKNKKGFSAFVLLLMNLILPYRRLAQCMKEIE